jgi:hypothetical protein
MMFADRIRSIPSDKRVNWNDKLVDCELAAIAASRNKVNGAYKAPRYCSCPELLVNGRRIACPGRRAEICCNIAGD